MSSHHVRNTPGYIDFPALSAEKLLAKSETYVKSDQIGLLL